MGWNILGDSSDCDLLMTGKGETFNREVEKEMAVEEKFPPRLWIHDNGEDTPDVFLIPDGVVNQPTEEYLSRIESESLIAAAYARGRASAFDEAEALFLKYWEAAPNTFDGLNEAFRDLNMALINLGSSKAARAESGEGAK